MGKKKKPPNTDLQSGVWPWAAFQPTEKRYTLSYQRREFARESIAEINFWGHDWGIRTYGYLITAISSVDVPYNIGLVFIPKSGRLCVVKANNTGMRKVGSPTYET